MTPLTSRNKKLLSYLVKFGILGLAFFFVYRGILNNEGKLKEFKVMVAHVSINAVVTVLILVVLLMIANWVLESLKWRYVTKKIAQISVWKAIEAVFCGLTWAVFTPNRIGEYGGRTMFLPSRKRIYGVLMMAVGSFGQIVTTCVLGALSFGWFLFAFVHPNLWAKPAIVFLILAYVTTVLVLYFNIRWFVYLLNKVKFLKKYHRFFDIMGNYPLSGLVKIIGFCVARVLVFTLQYCLIINLLIPEIPVYQIIGLMFVFFFIQSAMPSLDILDIGVRSLTADKIFGYVTNQHIAIIVAVSLIYLVNLIIPAILGSVFVFKMKLFDRAE